MRTLLHRLCLLARPGAVFACRQHALLTLYHSLSVPSLSSPRLPEQRELFLSCSSDGSVRLYSSLRMQPLLHLEPTPGGVHFNHCQPLKLNPNECMRCVILPLLNG